LFGREVGEGEGEEGTVPLGYVRIRTDGGSETEERVQAKKTFFI
jgi:hypothetical protein